VKHAKILGVGVAALLVVVGSWLAVRHRVGFGNRFASSAQVRYLDAQGKEVRTATELAAAKMCPADLLLEVSVPHVAADTRAALSLFDGAGRQLGGFVALEPGASGLGTNVSLRQLPPLSVPARALLLLASGDALPRILSSVKAPLDLEHASALADRASVQSLRIELGVPGIITRYEPQQLEMAEQQLAHGEFAAALARVEALAGTLPPGERARAAAVAAEAAFRYGRTALARGIARLGLAARSASPTLRARLQRVEILAIAEGSEATDPPPEREQLRQSAPERPDALERALDAVVDLRLAMVHDRFSTEPPRGPACARELLRLASEVKPEQRLLGLAPSLCHAVEVAAAADEPYEASALHSASALVRASGNPAAMARCAIARTELFQKRSQWPEAEQAVAEALKLLSGKDLPREQREAWYDAATLAARRGDYSTAFEHAQRAARWVSRLLALETDAATRQQLLINTVGYYGAAERLGALSGEPVAAIAVAESGKGNALAALMRGAPRMAAPSPSPGSAQPGALEDGAFRGETARIAGLSHLLGPKDAALSYTLLGFNAARKFELVIGVVTRERVVARIVEQPDNFLSDVVALAQAVEQNQEEQAKVVGMRLYATLLEPVTEQLAGIERLFVSPHLRLHTLPWNALHDGQQFLVHRFAFSRSLPLLLRHGDPRDDAPLFAQNAGTRWILALNPRHAGHESLPGFEPLADELRRVIPSLRVLTSKDATAQRLGLEIRQADVLLFAGHATYVGAEPLRSALFTAAAQEQTSPSLWPNDRLEAQALLRLDERLDLAILLGCETARLWQGTSSYGDEAVGLARAFLLTGARHVIGALWPVLDRDAEDFLRAIVSTEGNLDVVRQVQQANRCLAQHRCGNRGIAAWASFSVESR